MGARKCPTHFAYAPAVCMTERGAVFLVQASCLLALAPDGHTPAMKAEICSIGEIIRESGIKAQ